MVNVLIFIYVFIIYWFLLFSHLEIAGTSRRTWLFYVNVLHLFFLFLFIYWQMEKTQVEHKITRNVHLLLHSLASLYAVFW